MPATVLSLLAEKGGVGRTTTTVNIAGSLAEQGHGVLLIDTDPQASLSKFFLTPEGVDRLHPSSTVAGLFDEEYDPTPEQVIMKTGMENILLAPASDYLKEHNLPKPSTLGQLQWGLAELVNEVRGDFDYVIIDTPPDISNLPAWAGVIAADYVITPVVPETFSAQAIAGVYRQLLKAEEVNNKLRFLGYLINKRERTTFHAAGEERLRKFHGDKVFQTVVSNLTAFCEAQGLRQTITQYESASKAAELTRALTAEIQTRIEETNKARKVA